MKLQVYQTAKILPKSDVGVNLAVYQSLRWIYSVALMAIKSPKKSNALERAQEKIEQILNEYGPFLSLADAARRANVPLATLSDAVRHERVQSLRVMGKSYVRLSDVEAFIGQSKTVIKKKTWAQMVAEVTQIGDERGVLADFSTNFREYLYGE